MTNKKLTFTLATVLATAVIATTNVKASNNLDVGELINFLLTNRSADHTIPREILFKHLNQEKIQYKKSVGKNRRTLFKYLKANTKADIIQTGYSIPWNIYQTFKSLKSEATIEKLLKEASEYYKKTKEKIFTKEQQAYYKRQLEEIKKEHWKGDVEILTNYLHKRYDEYLHKIGPPTSNEVTTVFYKKKYSEEIILKKKVYLTSPKFAQTFFQKGYSIPLEVIKSFGLLNEIPRKTEKTIETILHYDTDTQGSPPSLEKSEFYKLQLRHIKSQYFTRFNHARANLLAQAHYGSLNRKQSLES